MLLESSEASELVWRKFHTDIRSFIQKRVSDAAAVDDLTQESFIRIHRGLDKVEDERRIGSWIFSIVRNLIVDHYRRSSSGAPALLEDPSLDENPDGDNENKTVGSWLISMIETLPPDYADALRRVELQGQSQAELAQDLGLSRSGAKSRVQRGRELLKKKVLKCCALSFDRHGNVVDYQSKSECC